MILTYEQALERASNKEWFKSFYKIEDCASDSDVKKINELAKEVGQEHLNYFLDTDTDILLQAYYVEDVLWYLTEIKEGRTPDLE